MDLYDIAIAATYIAQAGGYLLGVYALKVAADVLKRDPQ